MDDTTVKHIVDHWMVPTPKGAYMAGLEKRPVIASAHGITVVDTTGQELPGLRFRTNGGCPGPQPPDLRGGCEAQPGNHQSFDQDIPERRPPGTASAPRGDPDSPLAEDLVSRERQRCRGSGYRHGAQGDGWRGRAGTAHGPARLDLFHHSFAVVRLEPEQARPGRARHHRDPGALSLPLSGGVLARTNAAAPWAMAITSA